MTNEMIARDLMGWQYGVCIASETGWCGTDNKIIPLPDFLNDHNAAMMVVEKMANDGYRYESRGLTNHLFKFFMDSGDVPDGFGSDSSLCVAICEAALMAKGIDIESKG